MPRPATYALGAAAVALAAIGVKLLIDARASAPTVAPPPSVDPAAHPPPPPSDAAPIVHAAPADAAIVEPPPPPPQDAFSLDDRETLLRNVRATGKGKEPWDEQAIALFNQIAREGDVATFQGCFIAGCAVELSFSTNADFLRVKDDAERSDAWKAWTGGKRWSHPDERDGRILVGLVLYRPD